MLFCFQKQNKTKQKQRQNHSNIILSPCDEVTFWIFYGCTVEVLGMNLMGSNCIIHLMMDAITYPWYD